MAWGNDQVGAVTLIGAFPRSTELVVRNFRKRFRDR